MELKILTISSNHYPNNRPVPCNSAEVHMYMTCTCLQAHVYLYTVWPWLLLLSICHCVHSNFTSYYALIQSRKHYVLLITYTVYEALCSYIIPWELAQRQYTYEL
jgi:hypothetical protein